MNRIIHAIHHQTEKLLGHITDFWGDLHVHGVDGEHHYHFTMDADVPESEHFDELSRILVPLEDGGFEEFIIYETETNMKNEKIIYAIASYTDMDRDILLNPGTYNGLLREMVAHALPSTEWEVNAVESNTIRTLHLDDLEGGYAYLKKVASAFEMEMHFRITTSGNRMTGKYIDFVEKVGFNTKKEIEYGKDLMEIQKTVFSDRIVTALKGTGPEREDGTRLTSYIENEEAFQRWNRRGKHRLGKYAPESDNQEMTQDQLDQYTTTELNKRIASVIEYYITAVAIENIFPHERVRLGDRVRVKNPEYTPPLYADARIIRVERSVSNPAIKTYVIGEVKTYTEEDIYKTFRQLQAQYNLRIIRSPERPPGSANKIWIQTRPGSSLEIPHVWSAQLNDWVKIAPSTAAEIGAETPEGAQGKADQAEGNAKDYAETKDAEVIVEVNQTIGRTREEINADLATKAGLTYVDGKFGFIDSELSTMLGNINLVTGDVTGITSQISTLEGTSAELVAKASAQATELTANNGRLTSVEMDLTGLSGSLSATITALSSVEGTIAQQQTQINATATAIGLKASQESVNTLTGAVSDINAELTIQAGNIALKAASSELTAVDGRVTGLNTALSELSVTVDGITTNVSSLQTNYDSLSGAVTTVEQYASSIDQKADSIITDVTGITQTVNGHVTSINAMSTNITQLTNSLTLKAEQTQVDTILGQVNTVSSKVSKIEVDVTGITSSVSSLDTRIGSAESTITQLSNEIDLKVDVNGIIAAINLSVDEIEGSRINLIGAVTVLSEITGQLGNITAGIIDGVTFKSGTGTSRRFTLDKGTAEFIEESVFGGDTLKSITRLNDNGLTLNALENNISYADLSMSENGFVYSGVSNVSRLSDDTLKLNFGTTNLSSLAPNKLELSGNTTVSAITSRLSLNINANQQTLSIKDSTLRYNGVPIGFSSSFTLWTGVKLMGETETAVLSRRVQDCPNGLILVWCRYTNGAVVSSDYNYTFVHKWHATGTGAGFWNDLVPTSAADAARKYIYLTDTELRGHNRNNSGTESGQALIRVIAF